MITNTSVTPNSKKLKVLTGDKWKRINSIDFDSEDTQAAVKVLLAAQVLNYQYLRDSVTAQLLQELEGAND